MLSRTRKGMALEVLAEKVRRRKAKAPVQIGVRVPADLVQTIDNMAKTLKVQRSDVIRMLLSAAVAEALAETGEDLRNLVAPALHGGPGLRVR